MRIEGEEKEREEKKSSFQLTEGKVYTLERALEATSKKPQQMKSKVYVVTRGGQ